MKKLRYLILLAAIALLGIASCNIIEAPYIENPVNGNDTGTVVKKVLLEDFTGHRCINCPTASKVAHDLEHLYKDQLILVAVHASFLAQPFPGTYSYDFTTTAGDDYAQVFGVSAVPTGMVNRTQISGSYLIGKDNWGSQIAQELTEEADATIDISTSYNSGTRELSIDVETDFINTLTGDYNLIVLILEDGIIKPQMNNDPTIGSTPDIMNYEHNHVLRGAVNGSFGELIANTSDNKSYSITLDADWDESNMSVLAFISRADDADGTEHKVVQAEIVEAL